MTALVLALVVTSADTPQAFTGKVLPLAKALEKAGVKAEADTAGVALVTADGTLYTLVKDDVTRLLFLDTQLHDRQLRLTARRVPGTQFLQVGEVHTLKGGTPHEVYYWCFNCQLRANEPGPCKCCGGDTVLVEVAVKGK